MKKLQIKILYIGNNLKSQSPYQSTMNTLGGLLEREGFIIIKSSSIHNRILRMLDMLWAVFRYSFQVEYVLISTYSTANFYFALLTSLLSRMLGHKYIPILHGGNLPHRLDQNPFLSGLIFNHAFTNVAPSGYLQFEFEKRGYQTTFIPNVLNLTEYTHKKRSEVQPNLLWVRAFAHLYNPKMALYVLQALQKTYPQATLCMVGPKRDDSLEETIDLAESLGLEKSVIFTGVLPKEEWHKLSEDYDIFINTTTIDNTPVSVMEAMALGLPIVSTDVGGVPYLIQDGVDGLLVPSNEVSAMVHQIITLLTQPSLVEALTQNARKKAESFDWSKVREKWLNLLK